MAHLSSSCLKRERISDSVFELSEAGVKNIELSGPEEILGFLKYSEAFPYLGFLMDLGR